MTLHVSSPSCHMMCTDNTMHKSQTHKSCVLRSSPCKGNPQHRDNRCCLYLPETMRYLARTASAPCVDQSGLTSCL